VAAFHRRAHGMQNGWDSRDVRRQGTRSRAVEVQACLVHDRVRSVRRPEQSESRRPSVEITKNLPDRSRVLRWRGDDDRSRIMRNRSSFPFGQLKTSTLQRYPWVANSVDFDSRPGDPERSWKGGGKPGNS
jgi:hypothetical protein